MDIILPIPETPSDDGELVEILLPTWAISKLDRDRKEVNLNREDYLHDFIVDKFSDESEIARNSSNWKGRGLSKEG